MSYKSYDVVKVGGYCIGRDVRSIAAAKRLIKSAGSGHFEVRANFEILGIYGLCVYAVGK